MTVTRIVRVKSGRSGQIRKPLSTMTIQEKGLLGNRISLRRTGLFSGMEGGAGLFRKWLMYYLDFRIKYPPPDSKSEQVRLFYAR